MTRHMVLLFALAVAASEASSLEAQSPHAWGFVVSNGARIYYEEAGNGPSVVLIHGGWLNSQQWDEQFQLLSQHYHVVRYDLRGSGRSTMGDSAYSHADDLAALLAHLHIESAHLVALSQGSQIALDFAQAYPAAVRSLMIGASPLIGYDLGTEFREGMRGVVGAGVADDPQLTHDRMWAFAPFRVASGMPGVRRLLDELVVHQDTWAANRPGAPRARPMAAPTANRLEEVKVPVLVVVGAGEMPALAREAEYVAQHIAGTELVRVAGGGHVLNLEQPHLYDSIATAWLRRVDSHARTP